MTEDLRCRSCEHEVSFHTEQGCYFTVAHGLLDSNLVCPCAVSRSKLVGVVFREVTREDLLARREAILDRFGGAVGEALDELAEIDFLLDTCRDMC